MHRELSGATCYIVSPGFLREWFHDFVRLMDGDRVLFVDEDEALTAEQVRAYLATTGAEACRKVLFCASHRSLVRDCLLADALRMQGYLVAGITHSAVLYGRDKRLMKRLFAALGVNTPAWTLVEVTDTISSVTARLGEQEYLFKEFAETSGKGNISFTAMQDQLTDHYYAEVFVDGDEYSVVAVSTPSGVVTFPPVWKGRTQRDLYPSYKKLRVCPFPGLDPQLEAQMRGLTVTLAEAMGLSGLLEAEFVVTVTGEVLMLEINPRVAGTVLLSAMATETKIFSLLNHGGERKRYHATICAAEMPFQGTPVQQAGQDRYFSPRVTVSGQTYQQIYAKMLQLSSADMEIDAAALGVLRTDPGFKVSG